MQTNPYPFLTCRNGGRHDSTNDEPFTLTGSCQITGEWTPKGEDRGVWEVIYFQNGGVC